MNAKTIFSSLMAVGLLFGMEMKAYAAEAGADEKLCQDYWKLLNDNPLLPGSVISQRENHSSNHDFAKRSASLIQGTIGGRIEFSNFHHLPFEVTLLDRKIEGNLFVFEFGSADKLKTYLSGLPEGSVGKRGVLTAKAPQQFEVGVSGNCLLVLVVDGVRVDEAVTKLFERFEQMK